MNAGDQLKLIRQGFTIIRADIENKLIKCKTNQQNNWHTLDKGFTSIAAMRRAMDVLLKDSTIIED